MKTTKVKSNEIFKDIPNYEGIYQVSNLGNVKSLERKSWMKRNNCIRTHKEKLLSKSTGGNGYLMVELTKNNAGKNINIHQLMAMAFLNHRPNGNTMVINHKNFNKTDNRLENIEVVTQRENSNKKHIKSSSKYTGVCWNKKLKKWGSYIYFDKKLHFLGYYNIEIEASFAYEKQLETI